MNINSHLKISPSIILRNRVVVPPMASGSATDKGFVTTKTLDHYKRLAQSRASLLMVEYTYVHKSGKSEPHQLGISCDEHQEGLAQLAKAILKTGATPALQLTHAGAKSSRAQTGGSLISPSGIRVPIKDHELELPDLASKDDIELLKSSFLQGARRAWNAGFPIVELHSAHGYGLNQWISPLTNQRSDEYGGSQQNRNRLLLEIISMIKKQLPHLVLSVRMPGSDHFEKGLGHSETIQLAKQLEACGVSILNISSGIGGWKRPRSRIGEGYLVDDAAMIAKEVQIPVIGVGGIKSAEYINSSLDLKLFSLAAVGRAILEKPSWGEEAGLA